MASNNITGSEGSRPKPKESPALKTIFPQRDYDLLQEVIDAKDRKRLYNFLEERKEYLYVKGWGHRYLYLLIAQQYNM